MLPVSLGRSANSTTYRDKGATSALSLNYVSD